MSEIIEEEIALIYDYAEVCVREHLIFFHNDSGEIEILTFTSISIKKSSDSYIIKVLYSNSPKIVTTYIVKSIIIKAHY